MNKAELKIENVETWAYEGCGYLSQRTDYAKGYKDGIIQAKGIVQELLADDYPPLEKKLRVLENIVVTTKNRYEDIPFFQRTELSKEEVLKYADEMMVALQEIRELASVEHE